MLRLFRQISLRYLVGSWGRTAIVIGGVATGVALMVAINVINVSVLANFKRTIELIAGPAELEVTLGIGEMGFSDSAADIVREDPDVETVVPLVRGTIGLPDKPGEVLELFGVDLGMKDALDRYYLEMATGGGDLLAWVADPYAIALTATFAGSRGLTLGDTIRLSTPNGVRDFKIRGILGPDGLARIFGGRLAVMDLLAAQRLLGRDTHVNQLDIILRPDADVTVVQRRLEASLPPTLSVGKPLLRSAQYDTILGAFQAMLSGLSLLCLVAGVYIIYNTTSTAVVHRAFVMANLRVIGTDSGRLFRLFLFEAFVLGVLGTLVGLPTGVLLAHGLVRLVSESMGIIFQLRFPTDSLVFDPWTLAFIGVIGASAAVFASWFPARRVAALEPLEVMRADLRSLTPQPNVTRLVLWWIGLILISAMALALEVRFKSTAWGNFGSTLWFASSIVIAIPLVAAFAGLISRILSSVAGAEGRVAAESLFASLTRTGVTVAAITLVLTVAVTFASLAVSFRLSVSSYYTKGGLLLGDLVVSAVETEGGWLETPLPETLAIELGRVPGVESVEMARAIPGYLYRGYRITLVGLTDGFLDPTRYAERWYLAGDYREAAKALRASEGVNVSEPLADRFGLHVGDTVELMSPNGVRHFPVVGIVRDYMSDRGTIILNRRVLTEQWDDKTANRFNVNLAPTANADTVRERIVSELGNHYHLKVLSPPEVLAYHVQAIDRAFSFSDAIQLLIIIVTVVGILDLLLAAIIERRRELALWRVIGADEGTVRRSVVIESATIGVFGSILGCVVGLITAWTWIGINFRYLLGYHLEYHFAVGHMAWYVVLVMAMTIVAGYAAARRATQEPILQAIQAE